MSFLQPWLLWALPLILLPIIIHLINQWRYQTKRWGAMMFLLAANRMARGYAKLRQYLILAMRVLAVLGLLLAASRPLASGLLGLGGAKSDTILVLLDRSPSMQQRGPNGSDSKLETARRQLAESLGKIGANHWLLIDGGTGEVQEFPKLADLFEAPQAAGMSATSDVPSMLQTAVEYLQNNQPGPTEIWIASDMRQSDWKGSSSQWNALREAIRKFPQSVRIHLLSFPEEEGSNLSVRVTDVRQEATETGHDLVLSLSLMRGESNAEPVKVPIQFEVNGARSEWTAELTGGSLEIRNHRIPIDQQRRGWGRVTIPVDANEADNDFYFVFDEPPPRRTVVVAEDPEVVGPLELAASISPDPRLPSVAEVVSVEQSAQINWDDVGLLLWQGRLPVGPVAKDIEQYVLRGGRVLFFPPSPVGDGTEDVPSGDSTAFYGVRWDGWRGSVGSGTSGVMVENWRSDQDLLAATRSGASLPVGQLEIRGYAPMRGEVLVLASLMGGEPLLARVPTDRGGLYFCSASPLAKHSNLARGGIVLYVLVQRALEMGTQALSLTSEVVASPEALKGEFLEWERKAGDARQLSTEQGLHRGVYQREERLTAINRGVQEDQVMQVTESQADELFSGLEFRRLSSQAGSLAAIIREIWRVFLVLMILAMVLEALMCIPRAARKLGAGS